jgi:hypothetical protein
MAAPNSITKPTAFLNAVALVHLSHLFQDSFLRAAFKAAEDDGLAPNPVEFDHLPHLGRRRLRAPPGDSGGLSREKSKAGQAWRRCR